MHAMQDSNSNWIAQSGQVGGAELQQALDRTADSLSSAGAQLQTVQEKLDQTVHWLNYMLRATHF